MWPASSSLALSWLVVVKLASILKISIYKKKKRKKRNKTTKQTNGHIVGHGQCHSDDIILMDGDEHPQALLPLTSYFAIFHHFTSSSCVHLP